LINLTFSEDNWQEMRLYIAARLPANTRNAALYLLDALADMVRGMEEDQAADLVLAALYYLFLGKNQMIEKIFAMRECRDRLIALFERLSINPALGALAIAAGSALLILGAGTAIAAPPIIVGLTGLVGVVGVAFAGLATWLGVKTICSICNQKDCAALEACDAVSNCASPVHPDCDKDDCISPDYVKPPPTGDSSVIATAAAIIGLSALGLAVLLLKQPKKRRRLTI
jgi:hypothetical protein